jgi:hypothetical protein
MLSRLTISVYLGFLRKKSHLLSKKESAEFESLAQYFKKDNLTEDEKGRIVALVVKLAKPNGRF